MHLFYSGVKHAFFTVTNMYEYVVNKHSCPTDSTLQSVYEVQSSDLFTIMIP